jgi:hypothetical protein
MSDAVLSHDPFAASAAKEQLEKDPFAASAAKEQLEKGGG